MKIKPILFSLGLAALAACTSGRPLSQGTAQPVGSEEPNAHGLYYYLPTTSLQIEITAEKRIRKAGPFYRFSQRYLNITDVKTEDSEEWSLVDAKVRTVGQPDKSRLFKVNTVGFPSMAALTLSKEGVLLGLNLPPHRQFSRDAEHPFGFEPSMGWGHPRGDGKATKEALTLAEVNFNDVPMSEEQLIKSSTTAMAEEVAKEIYRLREIRTEIISGELQVSGDVKVLLEEMDRLEKAYLSLFVGKEIRERVTRVIDYYPGPERSINTVLIRFSDKKGFLDKMDVSGTPVYLEVEVLDGNNTDYVALETPKSENTRGLTYINPAKARVRVIDRTVQMLSEEVFLAQYGQLLRLPADLIDGPGVGVELDPATGALRRIFNK